MEEEKTSSLSDITRDRFKADVPGSPEADVYAEGLVAGLLAESAAGDSDSEELLGQILAGLVKGASTTGVSLWLSARGAMLGALRAAGACGLDHRQVIDLVPRILVRETESGGGDFGAAAKGAVEGAIEGATLTGIDEQSSANRAATAAYEAALELRESAAIRIRHITTPAVRGIPTEILERQS